MIQVIKHGDKSEPKPKTGECMNCGCVFTYTREDCYWDRPLLTYIVTCPECGNDIWLGDVFDE